MTSTSDDIATPRESGTPRREAMRAMGFTGAALLAVVGRGTAAQSPGKERSVNAGGSAWVVNVYCTEATNTNLVVGALFFSTSSFRPSNSPRGKNWFQAD